MPKNTIDRIITNLVGLDEMNDSKLEKKINQNKQALYQDLLNIIGEDEPKPDIPRNDYYWRFRNELRAKQRAKLKQYFGKDE